MNIKINAIKEKVKTLHRELFVDLLELKRESLSFA